MRRLAFITLDMPWPPNRGAQVRDFAMISRLASQAKIDLVAVCDAAPDPNAVEALSAYCESIHWVVRDLKSLRRVGADTASALVSGRPLATATYAFPSLLRLISELTGRQRHDLVQIEHSFLAPCIQAIGDRPSILSLHNVGALQYERLANLPTSLTQKASAKAKALLMQGWEARWASKFDRVVTMSDDDSAALRRLGYRGDPVTIGNGADLAPLTAPEEADTLLFVGNITYPPNAAAVEFLLHELLPKLDQTSHQRQLLIAGYGASRASISDERIEVFRSPESLGPIYRRAGIVLAPLWAGGGTRIKVIEAMAHGRPVVATRLAAEGLGVEEGRAILYAETADEFAARIRALRNDPELAAGIGKRARMWVEENASWDLQARRLMALHASLSPVY